MGKAIAELFYEDIQEVNIYGTLREEAAELVSEEAVAKGHLRDPIFLKELSNLLQSERAHHQEIENALLRRRIQQVNLAQNIVRLSPRGPYQYAMEAIAGTGLVRYRHFIDQVRSYAQRFEENLLAMDRADSHSLHVPFVKNGLSTQKVELEQVPVFAEDLSAAALAGSAVVDLVALGFFAVFTYLAAYLVWLRCSIAN